MVGEMCFIENYRRGHGFFKVIIYGVYGVFFIEN